MAGTNKIFKDLQDFAVDPPPGIFAKLWKKILRPGSGSSDPANRIDTPGKGHE